MSAITVEARAFPIENPKSNTLAFANVTLKVDGEDLFAVNGVRVVDSSKGPFVTMPQSKGNDGKYHDIACPLVGDLRKEINRVVLDGYNAAAPQKKQGIGNKLEQGKEKSKSQHTFGAPSPQRSKSAPGRD